MTSNKLEDLMEFSTSNDRVCPTPDAWNNLCRELRRESKARNISENLPRPLILSAWWGTNDALKQQRLIEQIRYSEKHGFLEKTSDFLRSLNEDDWHHCSKERLHEPSSDELAEREWQELQAIISEAKKLHAELVRIDGTLICDKENFASHMESFSEIFFETIAETTKSIEILQLQLNNYEIHKNFLNEIEKNYWSERILSMKSDILKLRILECYHSHKTTSSENIFDFCEQLFVD